MVKIMYIEMGYLFCLLFEMLLLGYLLLRAERKLAKLESVIHLINEHGHNTDIIIGNVLDVTKNLLDGLIEITKDHMEELQKEEN